MSPDTTQQTAQYVWITGAEAQAFARVSLKTLTRKDADGEEVGLRRVGRKLVFNRELLSGWLLRQTSAATAATH